MSIYLITEVLLVRSLCFTKKNEQEEKTKSLMNKDTGSVLLADIMIW
jgi:hypothetical protein